MTIVLQIESKYLKSSIFIYKIHWYRNEIVSNKFNRFVDPLFVANSHKPQPVHGSLMPSVFNLDVLGDRRDDN